MKVSAPKNRKEQRLPALHRENGLPTSTRYRPGGLPTEWQSHSVEEEEPRERRTRANKNVQLKEAKEEQTWTSEQKFQLQQKKFA
jgi:hypothetical protein